MMQSTQWGVPALLLVLCVTRSAGAHETELFAVARGRTIEGEVHHHGGGPMKNQVVRFLDPKGESLGQSTTDAEGKFSFVCQTRCDHRLVVDDGSGHSATFTVEANALPDDLHHGSKHTHSRNTSSPPESVEIDTLSRQIAELSKQLDRFQHETRLRDILGGIGYILGLAGVAFYFLGARRDKSKEKRSFDA